LVAVLLQADDGSARVLLHLARTTKPLDFDMQGTDISFFFAFADDS
jgi:hypothetical protein